MKQVGGQMPIGNIFFLLQKGKVIIWFYESERALRVNQ